MPDFAWRAAQAAGQIVQGHITAETPAHAMKLLRERGLTPLKIEDAAPGTAAQPALAAGPGRKQRAAQGPVNQADVLALTSELAIMLKAGLALDSALRVLIEMSHKPSVAAMLQQTLEDVKGGTPLSRALSRNRELFGDFYINMVRSGEASGQLSSVLARLVEHMDRLRALRESVISATIYPAILLGVAVISLVVMLGFVVPQFEKLFQDMGDALPMPTRIVMHLGHAFSDYGVVMAIGAALLGWFAARRLKSPAGRAWWQARLLKVPVIGRLMWKYELTLFSRSLGTLLGNGVPMLAALRIATETVSNTVLRTPLEQVAPMVKDGGKLVNAVAATQIFEPLAINLIRVGEETGRVGPMMLELANILNREVETGIKRALTLVEPVLILVLGFLIATIIVSILMGILSINDLAV
ncbi:type II secretion system F family protein [Xylophilus sp. GW821-FHT01B05]